MDILILSEVCNVLGKPPLELNLETNFASNGGDSLSGAKLSASWRTLGLDVTMRQILTSQSLRELIAISRDLLDTPLSRDPRYVLSQLLKVPAHWMSSGQLSPDDSDNESAPSTSADSSSPPSSQPASHSQEARVESLNGDFAVPYESLGPGAPLKVIEDRVLATQNGVTNSAEDNEFLTEMQLAFIHGTLKIPGTNIITHSETYYSDDIPALRTAWKTVVESEPIFNVDFSSHYSHDGMARGFTWIEAHKGDAAETIKTRPSRWETFLGMLFEVTPLSTAPGERAISKITWIVHHSLIDGYSAALVLDKVLRLANGLQVVPGPPFSEAAIELSCYQESHRQEGNQFWESKRQQLALAHSSLLLPSVSEATTNHISTSAVTVDASSLVMQLRQTARDYGITPSAFFNAAWALTLAAYSECEDVVFGVVLGGRSLPLPNVVEVVGPLVNTLPLLASMKRDQSAKGFVCSIYHALLELESFQWTTPQNGFSRDWESAITIQYDLPSNPGWDIFPMSRETRQTTEIPLSIIVDPDGIVHFRYHEHRFLRHNVERISALYHKTLGLLLDGDRTLDEVSNDMMTQSSQQLLEVFENHSRQTLESSIEQDLVTLFESHARSIPSNIAAEKGDHKLSYAELDDAAGRVASRLSGTVCPGDVVCVNSDRSLNWLIAIFAILKIGAVYCSLDCALPRQLASTIYELAGAKCYLVPFTDQLGSTPGSCQSAFSVEQMLQKSKELWEHRKTPHPASPAYVCFTSGSTGTPKGVMCTHRGLVAFQSTLDVRLFAQPGKRIAQIMSVAFDGSIHELFSALTHGATLVLPSGADPFSHLHCVDSCILTPSIARVLNPTDFPQLKWVYLVGEPVPQPVSDMWSTHKQLYNMYGPTEGTCGATIKRLLPECPVTIGPPNPTSRVYILDSKMRRAQPGMIGELYLAGIQVADGYLGLPQQTKERFLLDSVLNNGERMYKTGDRGYWTEDGEIVCLGRQDRQIKLRGYRLDLNDLEIRIARSYPSLEAIAITVAKHGDHLIAMVQPSFTDVAQLRTCLSSVLPPYAIPRLFIPTDRIPVTPLGKIDYKSIAAGTEPIPAQPREVLKTATEKFVASAFRSVLRLEAGTDVTPNSEFTGLGGHSLQQVHLARYLSKHAGDKISLREILERPTVRELAKLIDELRAGTRVSLANTPVLRQQRVSPIENEWLQKYRVDSGSSSFNVCLSYSFDPSTVSRGQLIKAWNAVLARHKLLYGRYVPNRRGETERKPGSCPPRVHCLRGLNVWAEANRPFDVSKEDLVRVYVTDNRLLIVLSHIVADYSALAILLREASDVYNGGRLDKPRRSYFESNVWFEEPSQASLEFWSGYLQGCPENPPLLGRNIDRTDYRGKSVLSIIHEDVAAAMLGYSDTAKVTLQQLAIAAVAACIDTAHPSQTDVLLGVPYINRRTADEYDTFGLFLEPLPVRIKYDDATDGAEPSSTYIQTIQSSSQAALANAIPWHRLLTHLNITPDYPNHPLFDVMVTFHDHRQVSDLSMSVPGFEPRVVWSEGAKFKLLCEFTALENGKILLRVEYDTDCIGEAEMVRLLDRIPRALSLISRGVTHTQMKKGLVDWDGGATSTVIDAAEYFDVRVDDV